MPLSNMKQGMVCVLKDLNITGLLRQKLSHMGLTPGTRLSIINGSVGGCSVIEVRGTRLALASNIMSMIDVEEVR
jgi:Fe2+ transport system protein FeoA